MVSWKQALLAGTVLTMGTAPLATAAVAETSGGKKPDVQEIVVKGVYTVNETIDTATGLGLSILETPQSVSVMTTQRMLDQNLNTIADVVANSVGVSVAEVDNVRNTFNARGFEIKNYQIDGVPMAWSLAGDSGETIADVAIYERIEVVRGATGLLTGAGDPSASINLVRKHADAREFEGFVSLGTGSWENREVVADVATPLTENGTVRARVVAKYEAGDSFLDYYEDEKIVLYGVVEADLTPDTLFRGGISYQNSDPTAPTWGALPTWYADGSLTDWDRSTSTAAEWTRWETTNTNYFANLTHVFDNGWSVSANFNRLVNEQKTRLLYLFGVPDRDTGLGLFSYPYRSAGKAGQNSVDVQVKGDFELMSQTHDFVVGALYSKQNADTTAFSALAFDPVGNFNDWDGVSFVEPGWSTTGSTEVDLTTRQKGVYAATRLSLTDDFKVILGGRLSTWEQEGVSYGANLDYGDNSVFIPYAGVLYDVTDSHRLYASYTEIFQPQNAQDRNGEFLDPLVGKSIEVGLKSSYFDGALQSSVALFRIEQDNLAVDDPGQLIPGTIFQASIAAQGTVSKGVELEIVGQPVEDWNVGFGVSWFKAEDAADQAVNTDQPRKLLRLFTTYRLPGNMDGLVIGGGINWQGRIYSTSFNPVTGAPQDLEQKSYALVNLMARYEVTEALSLQLNVDNLFNEKYYTQVGFFDQYRYGEPTNFSLTASYSF